jgi:hypothetical protein
VRHPGFRLQAPTVNAGKTAATAWELDLPVVWLRAEMTPPQEVWVGVAGPTVAADIRPPPCLPVPAAEPSKAAEIFNV